MADKKSYAYGSALQSLKDRMNSPTNDNAKREMDSINNKLRPEMEPGQYSGDDPEEAIKKTHKSDEN